MKHYYAYLVAVGLTIGVASVYRSCRPVLDCDRACQMRELQRHEEEFSEQLKRYLNGYYQPRTRRDI
jgi:hypothetical protein